MLIVEQDLDFALHIADRCAVLKLGTIDDEGYGNIVGRIKDMVIRGGGLGASMSRYLVERIEATPNIALLFNNEVVSLEGTKDDGLQRVRIRCRLSGDESEMEIRNLFLFVGADPATGWLEGCGVALDRQGFVMTGVPAHSHAAQALETSVPGVFAVGDVRSGSVKRVGGAIGEGAQVVAALHGYLNDVAKPAL